MYLFVYLWMYLSMYVLRLALLRKADRAKIHQMRYHLPETLVNASQHFYHFLGKRDVTFIMICTYMFFDLIYSFWKFLFFLIHFSMFLIIFSFFCNQSLYNYTIPRAASSRGQMLTQWETFKEELPNSLKLNLESILKNEPFLRKCPIFEFLSDEILYGLSAKTRSVRSLFSILTCLPPNLSWSF